MSKLNALQKSTIATNSLESSGKIKVGSMSTSGEIHWGESFELGPGLRKSFPVLAETIDSLQKRRVCDPLTAGVIFCFLLFCAYWQ